ncbi:hypothetical protein P171DRAFT_256846 [Karstenula rhodostoma CBS 690.94]|uniref:Uncharacterized protein n=1 Tax=Karstenula rhodostoma CBS 690.94 TaxID=1392251 RepID=A0A9P4UDM0_9PLEO|nr:hypothetical protein P171DRAFT_256846 [Karstenula rhodostoma CBS 690.94]
MSEIRCLVKAPMPRTAISLTLCMSLSEGIGLQCIQKSPRIGSRPSGAVIALVDQIPACCPANPLSQAQQGLISGVARLCRRLHTSSASSESASSRQRLALYTQILICENSGPCHGSIFASDPDVNMRILRKAPCHAMTRCFKLASDRTTLASLLSAPRQRRTGQE